MSRKNEIREFVLSLLEKNGDARPLADDELLLSSGRLQSIDAIEIVVFLEQQFEMDFSAIGFDRDALDSVDAIDALVGQHAAVR